MKEAARQLEVEGYTVLSKPESIDLKRLRHEFVETLSAFPEYNDLFQHGQYNGGLYVMGGFAALGNPSSFHNPFVRRIREWQTFQAIEEIFCDKKYYEGYMIEKLFDRMIFRKPGESPSPESWHRDETPMNGRLQPEEGDRIYGGWTNLSEKAEIFSCIPRSHHRQQHTMQQPHNNGVSGFAKIPKEECKRLNAQRFRVVVPPGCTIVFHQSILHEVHKSTDDFWHIRLHCGFRLTRSISQTPLQPDIARVIDE